MEMIFNLLQQGYSSIVPFIILLGFLIFVHELGHFLVAKWCGVSVEVFSLGFGKKILQKQVNETTYCISLIPLGGYVKMFGDEVGAEVSDRMKKYSFSHKTVWQRIAVVLAGPMMNFFFAIIIFSLVVMLGEEVRSTKIGDINPGTPAYNDGFRSGDEVLTANGQSLQTWDSFQTFLTNNNGNKVVIEVKREKTGLTEKIQTTSSLKPNQNLLSLDEYVGEIEGVSHNSKSSVIGVTHKSKAQAFGFQTGDKIVSINGKPVTYFRELEAMLSSLRGKQVEFVIDRLGEKNPQNIKLTGDLPQFSSLAAFGLESSDLFLSKIIAKTPAEDAGLKANDKIVSVNNVQPKNWDDVLNTVKSYSGKGGLRIKVQREGEQKSFEITPQMTSHMNQHGAEEKRFTIGIVPWVINAPSTTLIISSKNPFTAFIRGTKKTVDVSVMTVVSFLRLIQTKISPKNLGGIISIGQAASETFKVGLTPFLQLMGIISVNLFILNLLPIPVLDGGHLLFYSIEALRGAPMSMRKMEIAQQIGLVVLMSLMVLSLFNDVSRFFGFW
jgi:regulator of sigma E protease